MHRCPLAAPIALATLSVAACGRPEPPPPLPPPPPISATIFRDVTHSAGIDHAGPSYGLAVGDFDGDQWPDVWVSNHWRPPSLYRNSGDGSFREVSERFGAASRGDAHGAAWADFDRDGDLDLVELAGANRGRGQGPNRLFVMGALGFQDRARALGVDLPLCRARSPLWLDWEGDGDLDLVVTGALRPDKKEWSGLFLERQGSFERAPMAALGQPRGFEFAQLADVTGDTRMELVLADRIYPRRILAPGTLPVIDLTEAAGIPMTPQVSDAVWADFDGDQQRDLFVATERGSPTFSTPTPNDLETNLQGTNLGIRFRAAEPVLFQIHPSNSILPQDIRIGAAGIVARKARFRLDPANPDNHGLMPHKAGLDSGLYIGFDPVQGTWEVRHSHPSWRTVNVIVRSQAEITDVEPLGFNPWRPAPRNRLFLHRGDRFVEWTGRAGLQGNLSSIAVVAGDFDHDMDEDLYVLQSGQIDNLPNLLYLNRGDGSFERVEDGGGAPGSALGRADAVATLDFDRDGDLDLFLINGYETEPFATDGPHQLYENLTDRAEGGDHHWLQVDLLGGESNVEAIGARVTVSAGGISQLRVQDHGMHRSTQNETVLHFGLGPHRSAARVDVDWPSGRRQTFTDLPSDRLLRVVEPSTDGG